MKQSLTLSLIQMQVEEDPKANLAKALRLLEQAAENGAQMAVLPEMFICPYRNESFIQYAQPLNDSEAIREICRIASKYNLYVFAGSLPEQEENRIYNTCPVIDPAGKIIARHRKIHLFDIDVPGKIVFRESDVLSAGNDFTVINTPYGKIGVCICFDIRFPEMHRLMALEGICLLIVPAAFNLTTGPAHWDVLFRARAIDNQIFVAVTSPARNLSADYIAYGHSMIVDPWGEILADANLEETLISAQLTPEDYHRIKARLPLNSGRRDDLYTLSRKKEP